jgi:hypothetical protein
LVAPRAWRLAPTKAFIDEARSILPMRAIGSQLILEL